MAKDALINNSCARNLRMGWTGWRHMPVGRASCPVDTQQQVLQQLLAMHTTRVCPEWVSHDSVGPYPLEGKEMAHNEKIKNHPRSFIPIYDHMHFVLRTCMNSSGLMNAPHDQHLLVLLISYPYSTVLWTIPAQSLPRNCALHDILKYTQYLREGKRIRDMRYVF